MKSSILLLAVFAAALTSCTTAYKTGQTPDDVYYSPARPQDEYVRTEKEDDRRYSNDDEYYDDRYLRMKVRNRNRWSDLDDWYYYGKNYNYSYYNCSCWNSPWTPYASWNNYYNPYYNSYIVVNPNTKITYNKPRTFNLNTYSNTQTAKTSNVKLNTGRYNNNTSSNSYSGPRNVNTNSSSTNGSNSGNILRDIFGGNKNSNSSGNSSSNNSNNSSSSSSSGSKSPSSSSGSSAPVRRF